MLCFCKQGIIKSGKRKSNPTIGPEIKGVIVGLNYLRSTRSAGVEKIYCYG